MKSIVRAVRNKDGFVHGVLTGIKYAICVCLALLFWAYLHG